MRDGRAPVEVRGALAVTDDPAAPARSSRWRGRWGVGAGAAVVVCAVLVAVALWPASDKAPTTADVNTLVDKKVTKAITDLQRLPPASVEVYNAIRPPLVVIQTERTGGPGAGPGLGSGIVVNARGDILTSLHVVDGASTIKVLFSDGTEATARVRSTDPEHDIAVLAPAQLPEVVVPAVLGGGAQVGDEAFVVGNPLGLVASLSAGVISGLDRTFPLVNGKTLTGMIQFDAAANPGSSGGPLLNRDGQVIGIVTGIANASDDHFIGIGFAVPIGTAGGAAGAPAR